jgi:hypothetical protein
MANPGFRDLKPGITVDDVKNICPDLVVSSGVKFMKWYVKCYGIDNIDFRAFGNKTLKQLNLDMGPITSDGFFIDMMNEFTDSDSNIYRKMKKNFDSKYVLDFEYSERDRQLFNENEKRYLFASYSKGQVVLRIWRKEKDYSSNLWLYIEYRDIESGKQFLEENKPVSANLNDF